MFHFFQLTAQVLLKPYQITDAASCRAFLAELVLLVRSRAAETKTQIDDTVLNGIEFVLHNKVLFEYVYRVILEQLQTPEILFESADENTIVELVESAASNNTKSSEAIEPILILSLVTQIISFINTIKNK